MREIKFRQFFPKNIVAGTVLEAYFHYWGYIKTDYPRYFAQPLSSETAKPSQQFTGLLDKNGKEIYEGDIVAIYPHGAIEYKLEEANICEVKWSDENAGWVGIFSNISAWARHEVIGNIYENPNLLKEQSNAN